MAICHRGSSPRARGAQNTSPYTLPEHGIIPACAGSTRVALPLGVGHEDHPRVRGEHRETVRRSILDTGSSPRARGALILNDPIPGSLGIIPACAGSTTDRGGQRRSSGDHPRVRGEHVCQVSSIDARVGSSPRARGAPVAPSPPLAVDGIIPACAGSTGFAACAPGGAGDHPRVRGEHRASDPRRLAVYGSSPRARGAHPGPDQRTLEQGIIPACAGSTCTAPGSSTEIRDHPRVRGEHSTANQNT